MARVEILDVGAGEPGRDLWKIVGDTRGPIGLGLQGVARSHVQRDAKTPRFFKQEAAADRSGRALTDRPASRFASCKSSRLKRKVSRPCNRRQDWISPSAH
ncbi:hypothetical protein ABIE45_003018 [Methylobacterium sp. OAE515]